MQVLFAAGNDGDTSQVSNVISPSTAKNVLSVGATSNAAISWAIKSPSFFPVANAFPGFNGSATYFSSEALAYFSSSGPTMDGRFKPDISAPGHSVCVPWHRASHQDLPYHFTRAWIF